MQWDVSNPQNFGDWSPAVAQELDRVTLTNHYPARAFLFSEGQSPRGIYLVRRGVKLLACAPDGRPLILHIAQAGEVLGATFTIGGRE